VSQLRTILKTRRGSRLPSAYDMHIVYGEGMILALPYEGEKLYFSYQGQSMFLVVNERVFELIPHEDTLIYEITLLGSYHITASGATSEV